MRLLDNRLSLDPFVLFFRAHLGARVELLLLMRCATVWCIQSTSG